MVERLADAGGRSLENYIECLMEAADNATRVFEAKDQGAKG
jgi:hypothetical protein